MVGELEAVKQYAMEKNTHAWIIKEADQMLVDFNKVEKVEGFA
jgi:anti-anti-sigma regulatory factor